MTSISLFAQLADETLIGSERWTGGGSLGLVFVTLVLFLGLGLGAWYLNRSGGAIRRSQTQNLKVLETRPLGGRQFLMVMAYDEERFLLSVCPGRVEYLCALPSVESEGEAVQLSSEVEKGAFSEIVDQLTHSSKAKGERCHD
jgi:flagellar biogenesis protein FliO